MKFNRLFAASMLLTSNVYAATGFNSEAAHFAFGASLAGGISAAVDSYYPEHREHRAMIGFGISSVGAVLESAYEYSANGNGRNQAIDALSHIAGSALGAYVTDKFILAPVIQNSATDGRYIGLSLMYAPKH